VFYEISIYNFLFSDQTLFTATRGTAHGNDAIISRALNGVTLRTVANDKFWLHGK